jgi:putative peptide zinc metalloprotease protein
LRVRPDLVFHAQHYGGDRYWLVKDPLTLNYFHLRDEEYALLSMLDGHTSLGDIRRRFESAFAPLRVSLEQIHAFIGRLHQTGLLLADTPGQGDEMIERGRRRKYREWMQVATNLLAIRFRGIDPDAWLRKIYPACQWLFSGWFLGACLAMCCAAGLLVVLRFETLQAKLPDLQSFLTARNIFWLAAALAGAKVIHELAHALTARHFGAECHEIGVFLLVFTPCLYCNVSDAWLLNSKWQRIAVSAAGMVVEIVLASACTFLWWFSEPGLFNTICLSVMGVCSVSTVFFNGNPLLRYDGYYILADWAEVPNLGLRAQMLTYRLLSSWLLGIEHPPDPSLSQGRKLFLVIYQVASTIYRWLLVLGILWFLHRVLKPYHLEALAVAFGVVVFTGLLVSPLWSLTSLLRDPARRRMMRRGHVTRAAVLLSLSLGFVALVPLPRSIIAPAVLEPKDAKYIYVVVPGTLTKAVAAGTTVEKDQEIARLVNLDVEKEIAELVGQRNQQRLQLQNLRLRLAADSTVASEIPPAEEALADTESRLRQRRGDQRRLILRSPTHGIVLPPPARLEPPYVERRLDDWLGTPLDERSLGAHLDTGTLICQVGNPEQLEATLLIGQADMRYVRQGQRVRLRIDELPGQVLGGTIEEVGNIELKTLPRELAVGNELAVHRDAEGQLRPTETTYQARVALDPHGAPLLTATRGRARVSVAPEPLLRRLWDLLGSTFNFKL